MRMWRLLHDSQLSIAVLTFVCRTKLYLARGALNLHRLPMLPQYNPVCCPTQMLINTQDTCIKCLNTFYSNIFRGSIYLNWSFPSLNIVHTSWHNWAIMNCTLQIWQIKPYCNSLKMPSYYITVPSWTLKLNGTTIFLL